MINNLNRAQWFEIRDEAVGVVSEYIYLGQVVTLDPNYETEKIRRIRVKYILFGRHSQKMNGSLPLSLKRKEHDSCISPVRT